MRNYYSMDNRMVIYCRKCLSRMRVPVDKGKISVTCPACRNQFIYNPNSIPETIKQIFLSAASLMSRLPKARRNLIILIASILLILVVLLFWFSGRSNPQNTDKEPGLRAEGIRQEWVTSL